jgi:hypothetical protein
VVYGLTSLAELLERENEKAQKYGAFLDEEYACSVLQHELNDLFYYVRRRKLDGQGNAIDEWVQCVGVALRALKQFYRIEG